MKKEILRISIEFLGTPKGGRKIKRHIVKINDIDNLDPSVQEMQGYIEEAKQKIKAAIINGVKNVTQCCLHLRVVELDVSTVIPMEAYYPFKDKRIPFTL